MTNSSVTGVQPRIPVGSASAVVLGQPAVAAHPQGGWPATAPITAPAQQIDSPAPAPDSYAGMQHALRCPATGGSEDYKNGNEIIIKVLEHLKNDTSLKEKADRQFRGMLKKILELRENSCCLENEPVRSLPARHQWVQDFEKELQSKPENSSNLELTYLTGLIKSTYIEAMAAHQLDRVTSKTPDLEDGINHIKDKLETARNFAKTEKMVECFKLFCDEFIENPKIAGAIQEKGNANDIHKYLLETQTKRADFKKAKALSQSFQTKKNLRGQSPIFHLVKRQTAELIEGFQEHCEKGLDNSKLNAAVQALISWENKHPGSKWMFDLEQRAQALGIDIQNRPKRIQWETTKFIREANQETQKPKLDKENLKYYQNLEKTIERQETINALESITQQFSENNTPAKNLNHEIDRLKSPHEPMNYALRANSDGIITISRTSGANQQALEELIQGYNNKIKNPNDDTEANALGLAVLSLLAVQTLATASPMASGPELGPKEGMLVGYPTGVSSYAPGDLSPPINLGPAAQALGFSFNQAISAQPRQLGGYYNQVIDQLDMGNGSYGVSDLALAIVSDNYDNPGNNQTIRNEALNRRASIESLLNALIGNRDIITVLSEQGILGDNAIDLSDPTNYMALLQVANSYANNPDDLPDNLNLRDSIQTIVATTTTVTVTVTATTTGTNTTTTVSVPTTSSTTSSTNSSTTKSTSTGTTTTTTVSATSSTNEQCLVFNFTCGGDLTKEQIAQVRAECQELVDQNPDSTVDELKDKACDAIQKILPNTTVSATPLAEEEVAVLVVLGVLGVAVAVAVGVGVGVGVVGGVERKKRKARAKIQDKVTKASRRISDIQGKNKIHQSIVRDVLTKLNAIKTEGTGIGDIPRKDLGKKIETIDNLLNEVDQLDNLLTPLLNDIKDLDINDDTAIDHINRTDVQDLITAYKYIKRELETGNTLIIDPSSITKHKPTAIMGFLLCKSEKIRVLIGPRKLDLLTTMNMGTVLRQDKLTLCPPLVIEA